MQYRIVVIHSNVFNLRDVLVVWGIIAVSGIHKGICSAPDLIHAVAVIIRCWTASNKISDEYQGSSAAFGTMA